MSLAYDLFIRMCQDILENGTDTQGEKVRPKSRKIQGNMHIQLRDLAW